MQCIPSSLTLFLGNEEQIMRAAEREKGLLKLVYPWRYVEIYEEPITAAEILKKHPRHSVARSDVFEYPWIVVRPESVLKLGRVFYTVPNATIYKLIKEKGYNIQPSLQQNQPPRSYVHRQVLDHSSPRKASAGRTPMHEDHCQSDWQQFPATSWEEASTQEQGDSETGAELAVCERFNRASQVESLADMTTKYHSTYKEFKQLSITDSTSDVESVNHKEYHFSEVSSSKKKDDAIGIGSACDKQVTVLKSCTRNHDSARKLLHLKVSFFLPGKCEEPKRKVTESRPDSPSLFTC